MSEQSNIGIKFPFPEPYPKQRRILESTKRYVVCEACTKGGKTSICTVWMLREAMAVIDNDPQRPVIPDGGNLWWIAPSVVQAQIPYTRLRQWIYEWKPPEDKVSIQLSDNKITWFGKHIWFKTSDNPNSLYGDDVHRIVVDEATRCSDETLAAVRSTLTKTGGSARIISNVTGRHNWAYKLARLAQAGHPDYEYVHIDWRDAVAAGVYTLAEVEDAKAMLEAAGTPEKFITLYEARPAPDGGNPFSIEGITRCTRPSQSTKKASVYGIDVARAIDYSWVVGLDEDGNECFSRRWQTDWEDTFEQIRDIVGDTPALIDATGVGDPISESLCRQCDGMEGFKISRSTKQKLMEHLRKEIHQNKIGFHDPRLICELEQFEYQESASGTKYGAPTGLHDDGVIALALAAYCLHDPDVVDIDFWKASGQISAR